MIEVKVKKIRKVKLYCERCGSENVVAHASVRWDYAKQEWVFDEFLDGMDDFCHECECETCIEEQCVYEDPPEWP